MKERGLVDYLAQLMGQLNIGTDDAELGAPQVGYHLSKFRFLLRVGEIRWMSVRFYSESLPKWIFKFNR